MSDDRKLGLIAPPEGFVSAFPLAADRIPVLSWEQIKDAAKSGEMDGSKKYGEQFVMHQQHNNCAGASATTTVMKTIFDRSGVFRKLSETYTYSLINGGRDSGSMLADACESIQRNGCCLVETCGPNAIFRNMYDTSRADKEAARFRVQECYSVRFTGDEDLMWRTFWSGLALGFKAGVAIQAGSRFDRVDSYGVAGLDNGGGNHAVHADGLAWINGELVATSGNTWGVSWGMRGRMNLRQAHFEQTIRVHEHYLIRTAIDDPNEPMPRLKT